MRDKLLLPSARLQAASAEQGFTLVETMVALTVLLVVMGVVMTSMIQFSQTQSLVWNRANMHGGVRSATELLQQEVGQAGRVSLTPGLTTTAAITVPGTFTVGVSSTANMFLGEQLVIDAGDKEETVTAKAPITATSFAANFVQTHSAGVPVTVRGGFASGVIPSKNPDGTTYTNGSTGSVLKIHGDINGDGTMLYIEYVCTTGTETAPGNLYRNTMPSSTVPPKPAVNAGQILLTNVLANPGNTPCFTYEEKTVVPNRYVINVAITLTTQTQFRDRVTRQFQTETKALLNVAPRNVFEAWQLASMGSTNRIQPMPPSVLLLLP